MMTDATGVMPGEAVQGEEEAQASHGKCQHPKGMRRKTVSNGDKEQLGSGGNQESSDSEGKGRVFLEGQGGLQGQVSQKSVLWDW